jgi:nucleotide-binding universal stress UspA family protein
MLPCRKILCPIDFSEPSHEALSVAVELAGHFDAELTVLHVQPPSALPPDVLALSAFDQTAYEAQRSESASRELRDAAAKHVPKGIKLRTEVAEGDPGHEILMTAGQDIDLIVIATHGMTGWRHYLYGSVAQRVIQHTPCSVLVVRAKSNRK